MAIAAEINTRYSGFMNASWYHPIQQMENWAEVFPIVRIQIDSLLLEQEHLKYTPL